MSDTPDVKKGVPRRVALKVLGGLPSPNLPGAANNYSVLQAFTNEVLARSRFAAAIERAFTAARSSIQARAMLTAITIFLVFASVVVVLTDKGRDVPSSAYRSIGTKAV